MSTSACITTYSTRRSTTTAPGEKLKTATTSSSQMAALPNTSRVQSSALYRVHLSAAPCTPEQIGAVQISLSLTFPSPPIMEEKPGPRPQLAGSRRRHSSALYQPIPSAHARHMAHSTVGPALSPRSRRGPQNPLLGSHIVKCLCLP